MEVDRDIEMELSEFLLTSSPQDIYEEVMDITEFLRVSSPRDIDRELLDVYEFLRFSSPPQTTRFLDSMIFEEQREIEREREKRKLENRKNDGVFSFLSTSPILSNSIQRNYDSTSVLIHNLNVIEICWFDKLSEELLLFIFSFCKDDEISQRSIPCVSTRWRRLCEDKHLDFFQNISKIVRFTMTTKDAFLPLYHQPNPWKKGR